MRKWRALALTLTVANVGDLDMDMLLRMQQYIATVPHGLRCPCSQGIELAKTEQHFPGFDAVHALALKDKLLEKVEAEKTAIDLRSQRIERNWQESMTLALNLQGTSDPAIITH